MGTTPTPRPDVQPDVQRPQFWDVCEGGDQLVLTCRLGRVGHQQQYQTAGYRGWCRM